MKLGLAIQIAGHLRATEKRSQPAPPGFKVSTKSQRIVILLLPAELRWTATRQSSPYLSRAYRGLSTASRTLYPEAEYKFRAAPFPGNAVTSSL
jgi:hypothetical protein